MDLEPELSSRPGTGTRPIIKRKTIPIRDTVLGKRKLIDAFGLGNHDDERYGQSIPANYFQKNMA